MYTTKILINNNDISAPEGHVIVSPFVEGEQYEIAVPEALSKRITAADLCKIFERVDAAQFDAWGYEAQVFNWETEKWEKLEFNIFL